MKVNPLRKYLRDWALPHFFCPGCACGQILNFFLRAADEMNLDMDKLVAIGGVGCTARVPVYIKAEALHGVHGRTLPWATGIKLHNPELNVVVFSGDGGIAAIGGNHLIQAARRNLDVTVIVNNNMNYAMTGGQVAPTTPLDSYTTTTPRGNKEKTFDLCTLSEAAGATFVSRWTTNHSRLIIKAIKEGMTHRGFSLIEILGQCPTHFGRYALGSADPRVMLDWMKERTVTKAKAATMSEEELEGKIVVGTFVKKDLPTLEDTYRELEKKVESELHD
jgi:2-oxoglutarate ferredoxin oxidoreductase subunit beta